MALGIMANRTRLTPKKMEQFLKALAETCNVTAAARQIGMSRRAMYDKRDADTEFAEAWDNAVEQGIDTLEFEARRRAYEGVDEPVFHRGEECGHVRRYSDTLLMFLLRSHRPEKYRERYDVSALPPSAPTLADADSLTREQLLAIATRKPIPVRKGA